jgi:formylmethanofuran dehydrogenase subunit E
MAHQRYRDGEVSEMYRPSVHMTCDSCGEMIYRTLAAWEWKGGAPDRLLCQACVNRRLNKNLK